MQASERPAFVEAMQAQFFAHAGDGAVPVAHGTGVGARLGEVQRRLRELRGDQTQIVVVSPALLSLLQLCPGVQSAELLEQRPVERAVVSSGADDTAPHLPAWWLPGLRPPQG